MATTRDEEIYTRLTRSQIERIERLEKEIRLIKASARKSKIDLSRLLVVFDDALNGMTFGEIAVKNKISASRASQIFNKACRFIRHSALDLTIDEYSKADICANKNLWMQARGLFLLRCAQNQDWANSKFFNVELVFGGAA
mgnify:FL=1